MIPAPSDVPRTVSTGLLPELAEVDRHLHDAHDRYRELDEGTVADYIPALADADPRLFGLAVAAVNGAITAVGDAGVLFSVQSIAKAFVYALVGETQGHRVIKEKIGVDNTGLAFNSVIAIELNDGSPMNPMVNAGAIAAAALLPGSTPAEQWQHVLSGLSAFAGHDLVMSEDVYRSEMATNSRNRAIAQLLQSYGRLQGEVADAVDVYTRLCSVLVDARDLAVMGATLADGGVNPVTGARVVGPQVCQDVLAVLASTGMYERSGEWLFEIGIPAKSGVSGGIVAIAPGKGALGAFSPPLDAAGNSVRGQRATAYLSRALGLNIFASSAPTSPASPGSEPA